MSAENAVEPPSAGDVARFLGRGEDADLLALAAEHVPVVSAFVRAYVRGVGFYDDLDAVEPDISAVIVTATARLVTNPAQVEREQVDAYVAVGRLDGFTLPEIAVLHSYRRRTA